MGYCHTMAFSAKVKPGTTIAQVAEALKPVIDYKGYDAINAISSGRAEFGDDEYYFDPDTGELSVATYGEVGYSFIDMINEVARNLRTIVAEAGEIHLYDHETPNPDEAKTIIEFGPSDEAIKAYIAKRDIEAGLKMIEPHVSSDKLEALREILQSEVSHG